MIFVYFPVDIYAAFVYNCALGEEWLPEVIMENSNLTF